MVFLQMLRSGSATGTLIGMRLAFARQRSEKQVQVVYSMGGHSLVEGPQDGCCDGCSKPSEEGSPAGMLYGGACKGRAWSKQADQQRAKLRMEDRHLWTLDSTMHEGGRHDNASGTAAVPEGPGGLQAVAF